MPALKIGFAGVGFMGQLAHLKNYIALPGCEVAAIAEPRPHLRQRVAARYEIPQAFENHLEMLEHCPLDGIVASQPYTRHAILIPDILARKIPVFTEKPVALSVESGERLARLSEENQTLHMVGYHKRSDPAMEYAREVIRDWKASGDYGAMRLVRATMPPGDWVAGGSQGHIDTGEAPPAGENEAPPAGMDQDTFEEYNSFVNYYIHQVNALRFLLDEPYDVTHATRSGALLVGESSSGVTATLEMAPFNTCQGWFETFLVGFEHGSIFIELPAPLALHQPGKVTLLRDSGKMPCPQFESPVLPPRHAMLNQAMNFLAAIRGEKPAPCSAMEAVEDLRVARDYIRLKRG
ncbi:MAG: hypothetical protein AMXMBFR75_30000 [Candidatus Hinthialibacteria bacterium]